MKKTLKITGIVIGVLLILVILFFGYQYYRIKTGDIVQYNGKWMTRAQYDYVVKTLGDQYVETPAKNTPEEVYAKFREAVLKDDFSAALEQIRPSYRVQWQKFFEIKEEVEKFKKNLPETIVKEKIDGNRAYYEIKYNDGSKSRADFDKNINGIWQIVAF